MPNLLTGARLRKAHAWLTFVWLISVVPTVLWWRDSVLWVALLSVWANVASHFACYQAARAEDAAGGTDG